MIIIAAPAQPSLVQREPVLTATTAAVLIVTLLNVFGIVLDVGVVQNVIIAIVPIIAALVARAKVVPIRK